MGNCSSVNPADSRGSAGSSQGMEDSTESYGSAGSSQGMDDSTMKQQKQTEASTCADTLLLGEESTAVRISPTQKSRSKKKSKSKSKKKSSSCSTPKSRSRKKSRSPKSKSKKKSSSSLEPIPTQPSPSKRRRNQRNGRTSPRNVISISEWEDESLPLTSNKNTTKSVRFASPLCNVSNAKHTHDVLEEEDCDQDYPPGECTGASNPRTVETFEIEDNVGTSRGLEHTTTEGAWARYKNQRDASNAVFNEQDRQRRLHEDNPDKIAKLYRKVSKKHRRDAYVQGILDRKEIVGNEVPCRAAI